MVRSVALLAALILTALPGAARAEGAVNNEAAQAMVGGWEISNADRDRRCPLSFSTEAAPGGYKVEFDPVCPTAFPSLGDVVAWGFGPKDELRFLNAKGGAVLDFTEVENGMFESERGAEGLLFLQTQASLKIDARTAEQIAGDWNLLRDADKPLCRLTLSNTASGDAFRVVVKPGCDKAIAAFGPSTWRLDRDQLILTGRSGSWRFSESDTTVWERVPLTVDPLLLVRQ
jgi:Protease inhibitor Inh